MAKPKPKLRIQPDAAPVEKRLARQLEQEPVVPPPEVVDHTKDPDLRAFACLASFDFGWMTEPAEISWSCDGDTVTISKPESVGTVHGRFQIKRPENKGVTAVLVEIEQRWGPAVREKVQAYALPPAPPEEAPPVQLGPQNRFLRQLASQCTADPVTLARVEAALVEAVRRCGALARSANIGDASGSANFTRQMAGAAILDLIDPASRS